MKIEIELSKKQAAAIGTFADEFRLGIGEAVLALAIMQMNSSLDEEDARIWIRESLRAVDTGDWATGATQRGVSDWLPVTRGPHRALRRKTVMLSDEAMARIAAFQGATAICPSELALESSRGPR